MSVQNNDGAEEQSAGLRRNSATKKLARINPAVSLRRIVDAALDRFDRLDGFVSDLAIFLAVEKHRYRDRKSVV